MNVRELLNHLAEASIALAYDRGRSDEREACARLAEQQADEVSYTEVDAVYGLGASKALRRLADVIRARATP